MSLTFLELFVIIGAGVISVVPFWIIFKKAGFSPAIASFAFIPVVGIALLYYLAFAKWPAKKS